MRTPNGQYREYHTSADNLDFVTPGALAEAVDMCIRIVDVLEGDGRYVSLNPKCEPQLGRRGLYRSVGGELDAASREHALLWVLNMADGVHSLLDIAQRSNLPFHALKAAADTLTSHGLLKPLSD
jgi:aminopeptidase-like protein